MQRDKKPPPVRKLVLWIKKADGKWVKDGAGRAKFNTKWLIGSHKSKSDIWRFGK